MEQYKGNISTLEPYRYGQWIGTLDDNEEFVYRQGLVGSALSKRVCIWSDDVKRLGGKEKLREILDSIECKALDMQGYEETYSDILKVVKRVRNKFFKAK
jgi:hypothetical protein